MRGYLSRGVSNYRYPIRTTQNWILVIGHLRCSSVNHMPHLDGVFLAIFPLFAKRIEYNNNYSFLLLLLISILQSLVIRNWSRWHEVHPKYQRNVSFLQCLFCSLVVQISSSILVSHWLRRQKYYTQLSGGPSIWRLFTVLKTTKGVWWISLPSPVARDSLKPSRPIPL